MPCVFYTLLLRTSTTHYYTHFNKLPIFYSAKSNSYTPHKNRQTNAQPHSHAHTYSTLTHTHIHSHIPGKAHTCVWCRNLEQCPAYVRTLTQRTDSVRVSPSASASVQMLTKRTASEKQRTISVPAFAFVFVFVFVFAFVSASACASVLSIRAAARQHPL